MNPNLSHGMADTIYMTLLSEANELLCEKCLTTACNDNGLLVQETSGRLRAGLSCRGRNTIRVCSAHVHEGCGTRARAAAAVEAVQANHRGCPFYCNWVVRLLSNGNRRLAPCKLTRIQGFLGATTAFVAGKTVPTLCCLYSQVPSRQNAM